MNHDDHNQLMRHLDMKHHINFWGYAIIFNIWFIGLIVALK